MNEVSYFRRIAKLSQVSLATRLGWSQSRLSNYESGARRPGLDECRAINAALNEHGARCSLDELFPHSPPTARCNKEKGDPKAA